MSAKQVRVGDIGTRFLLTAKEDGVVVDISGASTKTLSFKKPSGAVVDKTVSFFTNGTDGKVFYDTIAGDLDEQGVWQYQLLLITSTGTWRSDIQTVQVHKNIA